MQLSLFLILHFPFPPLFELVTKILSERAARVRFTDTKVPFLSRAGSFVKIYFSQIFRRDCSTVGNSQKIRRVDRVVSTKL